MSNLASDRDKLFAGGAAGSAGKPKADDSGNRAAGRVLRRSVQQMRENVQRMRVTEDALTESSGKIKDVNDEYENNYSGALKTASEAMTSLKRRIDADDKYIWWSFLFFITVCVFIILKRLMIFSLTGWLLHIITELLSVVYDYLVQPSYREIVQPAILYFTNSSEGTVADIGSSVDEL
ncbi:hypothetical protein FOL47_006192 [Perkinsus chesapeaki]|uniref:Sec20 C-terminal domain-containing protein n=1 Tax=Perkinsus chesapeaki TaxID=330153 RepID=A0A7J6LTF8_PERCH|nr:hypothetical protein FOL47_006192 [Perkinsus chesapeaki]